VTCNLGCMKTEKPGHLVTLRMTDEQLKRLDDFRFEHRFFNRSETVRWLLDWALQHNPKPPKTQAERFPEPK